MTGESGGRRVVVTGQGVVYFHRHGRREFWSSIRRGACGVGPIKNIPLQDLYITIASEVKDFDARERCPSKPLLLADRYSQFAGSAAIEAMTQAGFTGRVEKGARRLDRRLGHRRARHARERL